MPKQFSVLASRFLIRSMFLTAGFFVSIGASGEAPPSTQPPPSMQPPSLSGNCTCSCAGMPPTIIETTTQPDNNSCVVGRRNAIGFVCHVLTAQGVPPGPNIQTDCAWSPITDSRVSPFSSGTFGTSLAPVTTLSGIFPTAPPAPPLIPNPANPFPPNACYILYSGSPDWNFPLPAAAGIYSASSPEQLLDVLDNISEQFGPSGCPGGVVVSGHGGFDSSGVNNLFGISVNSSGNITGTFPPNPATLVAIMSGLNAIIPPGQPLILGSCGGFAGQGQATQVIANGVNAPVTVALSSCLCSNSMPFGTCTAGYATVLPIVPPPGNTLGLACTLSCNTFGGAIANTDTCLGSAGACKGPGGLPLACTAATPIVGGTCQ